jgi:hypothetical protein
MQSDEFVNKIYPETINTNETQEQLVTNWIPLPTKCLQKIYMRWSFTYFKFLQVQCIY